MVWQGKRILTSVIRIIVPVSTQIFLMVTVHSSMFHVVQGYDCTHALHPFSNVNHSYQQQRTNHKKQTSNCIMLMCMVLSAMSEKQHPQVGMA